MPKEAEDASFFIAYIAKEIESVLERLVIDEHWWLVYDEKYRKMSVGEYDDRKMEENAVKENLLSDDRRADRSTDFAGVFTVLLCAEPTV